MQRMYQKILKECNGDQKYLRCPDLRDKNFEVLRSSMALDKVDLVYAETVQYKINRNYSGFITYSDTINVYGVWLDNSGYIITQL